jgi:CRISPR-associated protein Cas6
MFWAEEDNATEEFRVSDDVVDVAFAIKCPMLPIDHAYELSQQLHEALPWLDKEPQAGVHLIHGAASGNGWFRPDEAPGALLHLSRRARMRLRLPRHRVDEVGALSGKTLHVGGHTLEVGRSEVHRLTPLPTLFSRYVITQETVEEEEFLQAALDALKKLDVACRKLLCGTTHTFSFPDGPVFTRSLMVADLTPEHSIQLQQSGLGEGRRVGCGLFIPHKGIKPVKQEGE